MTEEFVDRPKPSFGYLGLNVGVVLLLFLVGVAIPTLRGMMLVVYLVGLLPVFLIMAGVFQAAFATVYRIGNGMLDVRCGWMMHQQIAVADIRRVEPARFISRVVGWSPGVLGYCNRMTNGLLLKTSRSMIFISPGDIAGFCRALGRELDSPTRETPSDGQDWGWSKTAAALFFGFAGVLFIVLAIPMILGVVPPNGIYGVRTATTMSSPEVWYAANRLGGLFFLGAGVAIVAGCGVLAKLAKRMSLNAVLFAGTGWTLVCLAVAVVLTMVYTDRIANAQFVQDEAVVGDWESVDFVRAVDDFKPGQKQWGGDLHLKGLSFRDKGTTSGAWRWSKGYTWHPDENKQGRYEIKVVDGTPYLFFEWFSGDGEANWYVMKRK